MIKLIVGKKGSGKTKTLIHNANESIKKAKGHVVFIDMDNSHMFQIDYRGRFMSIKDYDIHDDISFYGFICGVIASNYDIEGIFIDRLSKITQKNIEELERFFAKLDALEIKYNVNFTITLSYSKEELPGYLQKYAIIEIEENK